MKKLLIFLIVGALALNVSNQVYEASGLASGTGTIYSMKSVFQKFSSSSSSVYSRVTKRSNTSNTYACTSIHQYGYAYEPIGQTLDRYCGNMNYNGSWIQVTTWDTSGTNTYSSLGSRNKSTGIYVQVT